MITVNASVLKGTATITFDATLDGRVTNEDSNYDERFWIAQHEDATAKSIQLQTKPNPYAVPQFTVLLKQQLRVNGQAIVGKVTTASGWLQEQVTVHLTTGEHYQLEKDVVVVTSRDIAPDDRSRKSYPADEPSRQG